MGTQERRVTTGFRPARTAVLLPAAEAHLADLPVPVSPLPPGRSIAYGWAGLAKCGPGTALRT